MSSHGAEHLADCRGMGMQRTLPPSTWAGTESGQNPAKPISRWLHHA